MKIDHSIIERIQRRAHDPHRRTVRAGLAAEARPLDMEAMVRDLAVAGHPHAAHLQAMLDNIGNMVGGTEYLGNSLRGVVLAGPDGTYRVGADLAEHHTLPPPPSASDIARAQERIGKQLPLQLRQLYTIGDGGFGPGEGLFSLTELVERYVDATAEPGPGGHSWPQQLLPLFEEAPQLICIDFDSGEIICWDPELIDDVVDGQDWLDSFVSEADSLGALMQIWLESPTIAEQIEEARKQPIHVPQEMIAYCASLTPEERAKQGLGGEDWEEQLRRAYQP